MSVLSAIVISRLALGLSLLTTDRSMEVVASSLPAVDESVSLYEVLGTCTLAVEGPSRLSVDFFVVT